MWHWCKDASRRIYFQYLSSTPTLTVCIVFLFCYWNFLWLPYFHMHLSYPIGFKHCSLKHVRKLTYFLSKFWLENVSCCARIDECAVRITRNKCPIELVLSQVLILNQVFFIFFFFRIFSRLLPFSPVKKMSRGNSPGFYDSVSGGVVDTTHHVVYTKTEKVKLLYL
jgi:hypothetical protein